MKDLLSKLDRVEELMAGVPYPWATQECDHPARCKEVVGHLLDALLAALEHYHRCSEHARERGIGATP